MEPFNSWPRGAAIVGEAVAGREAKSIALRKRMLLLSTDLTKNTFDLAEAFLEAQESHCYLEWGFDSIGDYASLELGMKHRKAQYLARIVRVCRECGVARKDYEPVGVTKLREITTLEPGDTFYNSEEKKHEPMVEHIVRLIAEAPENSTVELEEEIKRLKGMTGENAMVTKSYSVTLSAYENVVKRCFESIRKRLGSAGRDGTGAAKEYTDGNVIECLAAEYNSDPRNFMEETDESHEQIEIPEESNVRDSGALDTMDSEEVPQDSFQRTLQPFVLPTEN
jgi:hypothetical protein